MRIEIVAVGKLKAGPETELLNRYLDRTVKTGRAAGFTALTIHEIPESRADTASGRKADEARAITNATTSCDHVIALDETGISLTTKAFAQDLRNAADSGIGDLAFVIGGADGLDGSITASANHVIAFGALTWPHQIVRILLAEQLYRAMTIFTKHPYHRA